MNVRVAIGMLTLGYILAAIYAIVNRTKFRRLTQNPQRPPNPNPDERDRGNEGGLIGG